MLDSSRDDDGGAGRLNHPPRLQEAKTVRSPDDTGRERQYAASMKSGQAVDERVAISRGTCFPHASPCRSRRTAGQFVIPQAQGAGGGRIRRRIRLRWDFEPVFPSMFSLN